MGDGFCQVICVVRGIERKLVGVRGGGGERGGERVHIGLTPCVLTRCHMFTRELRLYGSCLQKRGTT